MKNLLRALLLSTSLLMLAAPASAAEPFTEERVQATGKLGFGFWLGDGELNAYLFNIGARGGYTIRDNFYFGGRFDYFFGESDEQNILGAETSVSANAWEFLGEVGYDIPLSPTLVVRPKVGFGPMQVRGKLCADGLDGVERCETSTDNGVGIALGAELPIDLNPVLLAPELRFNFYSGSADATGLLFGVHVGMMF